MLFLLVMVFCSSPIDAMEPHSFRGIFKGRCHGDGLYYNDEESFVMCISRNYYIQPCPPGTKNRKLRGYNDDERFVNFESFCDVNLVNFGYHPTHPPKHHKNVLEPMRSTYEPSKVPPEDRNEYDFISQTEYMYQNPHKYISDPLMHREPYPPRDVGPKYMNNNKHRSYVPPHRPETGYRPDHPVNSRRYEPRHIDIRRPKNDVTKKPRNDKNKASEDDKERFLYMVISMPKDMMSKFKDYETMRKQHRGNLSQKDDRDRGSISYHQTRSPQYGPISRPSNSEHRRPVREFHNDKAYYNSKDHGASHYPPPRPPLDRFH